MNNVNELRQTKDFNGEIIKVGDEVVIGSQGLLGTITAVYKDEVDIHHDNSHQGPVIDTFNIKGHEIWKIEIDRT